MFHLAVDVHKMSGSPETRSEEMLAFVFARSKLVLPILLFAIWAGDLHAQAVKTGELPPTGQQTTGASIPNTQGPIAAQDYVIGPDDLLNVYILDVPELSRDYRVNADGTVSIPTLDKPFMASGLTLSQFSEHLSQELRDQGLVSDPHITVSVNQSRLHSVAITGAVKAPQIYPVLSQTTLLDVLSQAGGLADDAGNTAIVRRGEIALHALHSNVTGEVSKANIQGGNTLTVDLKQLLESGDPSLNPTIYPGDRITVPQAGIVYVIGAVNKPGGFNMKDNSHGITVLQALALAEDTNGTAIKSAAVILRRDPQAQDGRERIPVDIKAVLRGKKPDPLLQAEDILFVPDSSRKRAFNRGIQSVVAAATGVAIYGGSRI